MLWSRLPKKVFILEIYIAKRKKRSCQSSQQARFFTYKTELKKKQYHFKAPQVEIHDVRESIAVIHFTIVMIKNRIKFIIRDGVTYVRN